MSNSNLTPDEERVLRKLLAKQKRKTPRRKQNSRRVKSLLAKDGVAEVILFLILVVVFLGYISR